MTVAHRRNPLALAVLACLVERPMHPYEVARTLRQRAKHESIRLNYGSLYKVVDKLEQAGLIHARATVREGRRPERTVYEVTDAGSREFVDWLSDLVAVPAKEYLQFEAALSLLPGLPPEEAASLLADRCEALEGQLHALRAARRAGQAPIPRLFVLESEYLEALHEAELAWLRGLVDDIEQGTLEGLAQWREFHAHDQGEAPATDAGG